MVSTLERGGLGLAPTCRLQFSQSSQPTPSQHLSRAMGNCRLGSQTTLGSQAAGEEPEPCATQSMVVTSQDYVPGSQDFITPADQQYATAADAQIPGRHVPSPAQLSPNRIKRARSVLGDEDGMDCCPQPSQRCNMEPPPKRPLVVRQPSPPAARNIFLNDIEDEPNAASHLHKRPPFVSRYREEFRELRHLGGGSSSKVLCAKHRFDGLDYAIKRSRHPVISDLDAKRWQQEAMAMAAAGSHPGLVRYYGAWTERAGEGQQHFYLQLELCGESLDDVRRSRLGDPFPEAQLVDILRQMAEALQHLHERGIAHMDVKPDNIYADAAGSGRFKLGDFGLATARSGKGFCQEGDARYIPLEVLNDDFRALDKADVFMLGASLYELATNKVLETEGATYQLLRSGKALLLPGRGCRFVSMLKAMLSPSPADRPSPAKILASSLLTKRAKPGAEGGAKENYGALPFAPTQQG